eukprot:SAG22_NODE_3234_length_1842_cov_1.304073_2_plen_147_part_00
MKSPHAYLVLAPALQLEQDYHVEVDWMAYQLEFVEMGISTKHEADGARVPPSENSNRRAKMFYSVAREYAKLQGVQIRGPHKLLHSRVANLGLMFARERCLAAPYMSEVFAKGWPNGWREYDMECSETIGSTLAAVAGCDASSSYM